MSPCECHDSIKKAKAMTGHHRSHLNCPLDDLHRHPACGYTRVFAAMLTIEIIVEKCSLFTFLLLNSDCFLKACRIEILF